jgi:mersacidin/lichenicidin family type 2 lantibiotic
MSKIDIIRAWKDEEYRWSLNEAERALLPDHPSGLIELNDNDMMGVVGGNPTPSAVTHSACCNN